MDDDGCPEQKTSKAPCSALGHRRVPPEGVGLECFGNTLLGLVDGVDSVSLLGTRNLSP